jgi:hypothetical protein
VTSALVRFVRCREAEARARTARQYDATRARFQRALLAAEDLEGADTLPSPASVGHSTASNGHPSAASGEAAKNGATSANGGAGMAGAGGNPFMASMRAGSAAAERLQGSSGASAASEAPGAAAVAEAEELGAEPTDVFDPAGWDEDVRRQWDAFVSSSRVRRQLVQAGRLLLLVVASLLRGKRSKT